MSPEHARPLTPGLILENIGEIYCGTLDLESGILEKTHTVNIFYGDESWTALGNDFYRRVSNMALGLLNDSSYCDRLPKTTSSSVFGIQFGFRGNTNAAVYIREPENIGVSTQAELKAWLRGNPVKVVYELAEHEYYQLSKPQIISSCVQLGYPYLDYLNMITDRTQEDVDELIALLESGINPPDHKGAYNASDLNRLGEAIEYINTKLQDIGIEPEDYRLYRTVYELPSETITLRYNQSGNGEPSEYNIRPILPAIEIEGIGEIFGGTLDGQTATLTITHHSKYFSGNERWRISDYNDPYTAFWVAVTNDDDFPEGKRSGGDVVFSHVPNKMVNNRETDSCAYLYDGLRLWCRFEGIFSLKEFKGKLAYFADRITPFQMVYELEEPKVLQLSNTQIEQVAKQVGEKVVVANTMKTDWDYIDIPCDWQMDMYIQELKYIKSRISEYRTVDIPGTMRNLNYEGANQIEMLFVIVDNLINNITKSYRGYSGRLHSGGGCLP